MNKGSFVKAWDTGTHPWHLQEDQNQNMKDILKLTLLKLQPTHLILIARFLLGKNPKEATPAS